MTPKHWFTQDFTVEGGLAGVICAAGRSSWFSSPQPVHVHQDSPSLMGLQQHPKRAGPSEHHVGWCLNTKHGQVQRQGGRGPTKTCIAGSGVNRGIYEIICHILYPKFKKF